MIAQPAGAWLVVGWGRATFSWASLGRIAMQSKRFVAFVVGAGAALLWVPSARAGEIEWIKSYDEGQKTAKQRGALMVLDFYADW